jgi:RNA polymerase sigma factor (sigma-70 family)
LQSDSEDLMFVNRCLDGDWAAFAFLVDKYKEVLHAYAYHRTSDYQVAQDITQEVLIKAYRKLGQLKWPHRFRSWLYTIASNECKMWLRKHSKEREQQISLEDVPVEELDEIAVRNHSDEDIRLTVKSAIETLPTANRLALSLHYMSGLSVKETAEFMGISPNNVKVRLHRARKQLGERLMNMVDKQMKKEKLRSGFVLTMMNTIRNIPIPSLPKPRPIRWAPIPISIGLALLIGVIGYGVSSGKDVSLDMPILKPAEATFEVSLLPEPDRQTVLDTEPENTSNLVAESAGDPQQTQPIAGTESSGIVVRRVWEIGGGNGGMFSPDGRYRSGVAWANKSNLAIRDFNTGEKRDVTDEGRTGIDAQFAAQSIWSPDSKQLAYVWVRGGYDKGEIDLRIVGISGSKPRVLFTSPSKSGFLMPQAWSQDGKHILAVFYHKPGKPSEIALVSVADGSIRVLKSLVDPFDWRGTSISPDGRYVVYDSPQSADSSNRDLFLVATDGSHETKLVEHPADDRYPFWASDGNWIVFVSDRSGSMGVWVLEVADGKPKGSPRLIKQNLNAIIPLGLTQDGSYYYTFATDDHDVYMTTLDPGTGKVVEPPVKAVQSFEGFNSQPAFSPDGKYLAYISHRARGSGYYFSVLVIHSMETGQERVISPKNMHIRYPCWSPDGRSILVDTIGPGLYQVNVETGALAPVVSNNEQGAIYGAPVGWHPDGSRIFFMRRSDDISSIRVYDFETKREWQPDFQLACGEVYGRMALSPDGQQLAFEVSCDNEWSVQIAPSSGGDAREVLRLRKEEAIWGCEHTWTQDGRYLLFTRRKDEATELWRIPVEGGDPVSLGLTMKEMFHLSIRPDGRRIAFTGPGSGHNGIWAMENFLPESTADR